MASTTDGVWVAYNPGGHSVVPYASEVEALRHAVANCMSVKFLKYGTDVQEP